MIDTWKYKHIPINKKIKVGKIKVKAKFTIEKLEKLYNDSFNSSRQSK
jgi:hypothetical protein